MKDQNFIDEHPDHQTYIRIEEHIPDRWVILKIGDVYKVFGMWVGSYIAGNSYRINSGIISVEEDGDYLLYYGYSGSVYKCHKNRYGLTSYGAQILENIQNRKDDVTIEVLEDYTEYNSKQSK